VSAKFCTQNKTPEKLNLMKLIPGFFVRCVSYSLYPYVFVGNSMICTKVCEKKVVFMNSLPYYYSVLNDYCK
jgi:hypothetical protein